MDRIKETVNIAEKSALLLGALFLIVGITGTPVLVSLFGVSSDEIKTLAIQGIKLFFTGYLFIGINFIYMTYYQSIGQIGPAILIIVMRGFILLFAALWILPQWIGVEGVWLALPVAELLVAVFIVVFTRKYMFQGNYREKRELLNSNR